MANAPPWRSMLTLPRHYKIQPHMKISVLISSHTATKFDKSACSNRSQACTQGCTRIHGWSLGVLPPCNCTNTSVHHRKHTIRDWSGIHAGTAYDWARRLLRTCRTMPSSILAIVLHGERFKRLIPPRNTKHRRHLQSTQTTINRHNSHTKHLALSKGQPGSQDA